MNLRSRIALLGAAALIALLLPAHATGSVTVGGAPSVTSSAMQQLAQRVDSPKDVFFKKPKQPKKKKPKK
jgi:hypothetical protein